MREPRMLLERSCGGQARLLGPEHPEALGTLDALGHVLSMRGELASAEAVLRRAAEARQRVLGPAHPDTLRSRKHLGHALADQGRIDEALPMALEVAEGHRQVFGPTHIQTSSELGLVLSACRKGRQGEVMRDLCEGWLREILASPVDADPYQRDRRAVRLGHLALVVTTLPTPTPFDAGQAVAAARAAVTSAGSSYNWSILGTVLERTGHPEEAMAALQEAAGRPGWKGGGFHWFTLARLRARAGEMAGARRCYEKGILDARESWASELHILCKDLEHPL